MAAKYVDDGANDGPAASVWVVHIATEGFRDVGRYEVQRKRAERASGTDVAAARPVPAPSPRGVRFFGARAHGGSLSRHHSRVSPCSGQEPKEVPAETRPFLHAMWRGALLCVDLVGCEPLPVAPCYASVLRCPIAEQPQPALALVRLPMRGAGFTRRASGTDARGVADEACVDAGQTGWCR